jgi:hypothetical protein
MTKPPDRRAVEVGVMIASTPGEGGELETFARQLARDVEGPLADASGREWSFHTGEVTKLDSDARKSGADFVAEASLRLAEGAFDLMVVITDAPLLSGKEQIVSGVASPLTRICVLSTRQLRKPGRGPDLPVGSARVRRNSATLLLNLVGRILGAGEEKAGAMARFRNEPERKRVEPYVPPERIRALADRFIEPAYHVTGPLSTVWAHVRSIFFDPAMLMRALVRNRALLLPLRLSGLAAAAVATAFVLVFTAEIWDTGLHMANRTAELFSLVTVAASTIYLSFALKLFLPRKDTTRLPRHLALANVVIFMTILFGLLGLYVMVILVNLGLEILVVPHQLAHTLPTLPVKHANFGDKLRMAGFVSGAGVMTGALAGGLQGRDVLRQLALFETAA